MVLAHNIADGKRTGDVKILRDVTFENMLLTPNTLEGLNTSGFYKPSPVQLQGIPLGKCGFDLLLEAKSGTGKTAVFTVIALEKLDLEKGLQTIILAPTREIAAQVCDVIKQLGSQYKGLVVEVVMGGLSVVEDICKFKRPVHIVVGSPGRLRHLIQSKHIDGSAVRLLVLDEADKLMEKSFQADINYIFSNLPPQKQVIMSSATYPEATKGFIDKYVNCAQHVCPESNSVLLGVEQKITVVKCNSNIIRQTKYRLEELLKILTNRQFKQCLIFCNYQARVAELFKTLTRGKWPVEQLCGQQDQTDRLDALKTLKEYKCRILVSTDLAARGIDASNVDLVINFEPPYEWQTYLHRIGRAGRFGTYGMSITILSEGSEEMKFKTMLETIKLDSIKVGNLWDNNDTDNNNTTNLPLSQVHTKNDLNPTKLEIMYKDVWNDLIGVCNNNNGKEEYEEFDTLCKSFEELNQVKIESFTDLLNSFEQSKKSAVTDSYHCTKIKPKSIKSFFESMTYLKNCIYNEKEIISTAEETTPNETDIKVSIQPDGATQDSNSELKLNSKDINIKELDNLNKKYSLNTSVESDALENAGLPSSFGSTKQSNKYKKINKNNKSRRDYKTKSQNEHNTENIGQYEPITTDQTDLNHACNDVLQDEYYGMNFFKEYCKESCDQEIIDQSYKIKKVKFPKKKEPQSYKVDYSQQTSCDEYVNYENKRKGPAYSSKNSTNNHVREESCSNDYVYWYTQLKNRVKQIEMALYIEELSKL